MRPWKPEVPRKRVATHTDKSAGSSLKRIKEARGVPTRRLELVPNKPLTKTVQREVDAGRMRDPRLAGRKSRRPRQNVWVAPATEPKKKRRRLRKPKKEKVS